jgi:hypothetical protein
MARKHWEGERPAEKPVATPAPAPEAQAEPVASESALPAGRVRARVLRSMLHQGNAHYAGEELVLDEAVARDRAARGDVELL